VTKSTRFLITRIYPVSFLSRRALRGLVLDGEVRVGQMLELERSPLARGKVIAVDPHQPQGGAPNEWAIFVAEPLASATSEGDILVASDP
jgi:hypothetical protein